MAFQAIRDKELLAYLGRERIGDLAENPYFLDVAFGLYWDHGRGPITARLQPAARFDQCPRNPWGATLVHRVPDEELPR